VELSVGVMRRFEKVLELAKICQQCHMSVMGYNIMPPTNSINDMLMVRAEVKIQAHHEALWIQVQ